jgi:hypothetical protein
METIMENHQKLVAGHQIQSDSSGQGITTCTACTRLYVAGSEEQASEPVRLCPLCRRRKSGAEPLTGAACNACGTALQEADAMGGYHPCPRHPRAKCRWIPRGSWRALIEEQQKEQERQRVAAAHDFGWYEDYVIASNGGHYRW